jgi:hypothetical protein
MSRKIKKDEIIQFQKDMRKRHKHIKKMIQDQEIIQYNPKIYLRKKKQVKEIDKVQLEDPDDESDEADIIFMDLCIDPNIKKTTSKIISIISDPHFDLNRLNLVDEDFNYTILMWACKNKNKIIANRLLEIMETHNDLEYGLIDYAAPNYTTALLWACRNGLETIAIRIFELIQQYRPDLKKSNIAVQDKETGNNALMWACINTLPHVSLLLVQTQLFNPDAMNNEDISLMDIVNERNLYLIRDEMDIVHDTLIRPVSGKPQLKRLPSHENKKHFQENGIIFYINGHSFITGQIKKTNAKDIENTMSKSIMMFLKSFGETTIQDEGFNEVMQEKIMDYLFISQRMGTIQNYSTLYQQLSSDFEPTKSVCEEQQPHYLCNNMSSLLRYLPLYYDENKFMYVFVPKRDNPELGTIVHFNRIFQFNSEFNVFSLYFTRHQIAHPTILEESIDAVMELVSLNLCYPENNTIAMKYLCIYFILFYQSKFKLTRLAAKTFEQLSNEMDEELDVDSDSIINHIQVMPHYYIDNHIFNAFLRNYFGKLNMDGLGKPISQSDKNSVIRTFATIFKLPLLIQSDPSIKPIVGIDLDIIININNMFKCVGIGEAVIISKSCNTYNNENTEIALLPLQDYMDEYELHPGELKAREYGKVRKISSVDNYDKPRSFSKKRRSAFQKHQSRQKVIYRKDVAKRNFLNKRKTQKIHTSSSV